MTGTTEGVVLGRRKRRLLLAVVLRRALRLPIYALILA